MQRSRERRLRSTCLAAGFAIVTLCLAAGPTEVSARARAETRAAAQKPNFVFILTDDQSPDSLDPGAPVVMPKLEARLADPNDHWIRFSNFFFNTPLCCPSRATILTGQYSHHTGVQDNSEGGNLDDEHTIATWLDEAGYRTGLVGKYLNGYPYSRGPYTPPGWDSWFAKTGELNFYYKYTMAVDGALTTFGNGPADYSTDAFARRAVDFIHATPTSQPFMLYLSTSAPHGPWVPAPRHEKAFKGIPMPHTPAFNEADVSDKPAWVRALPLETPDDIERLDRHRRAQDETLLAVDDAVDRVLAELRASGRLDDTVVVFMTDNGFSYGEHRWQGKRCVYDECLRSPFFVRYPGAVPHVDGRLISNTDIAPTFAELAGTTPDIPQDGMSLAPLLEGPPPASWRSSLLIEYARDQSEPIPGYWAVRTRQHLYAELDTGERELYDADADPYQLRNRAGQPAYASVQSQLASTLHDLLGADLSVSMDVAPHSTTVGGTVTLTTDVKNLGPGDASGVTLDEPLPSGLRAVSATSTAGTCDTSVRCTIGALPTGAKATVTVVATGTQPGTFSPTASASGSEPDPSAGNDVATSDVTVEAAPVADLSMTLSDAPDPVVAGGTFAYTARISNAGPNAAQGVTLTDTLPAGVTVTSMKPGTKCRQTGATVSCALGSVAAGATSTAVLTVRPDAAGQVTNTASVSSTTDDPDAADRTAASVTTVTDAGSVDLRLTGSATPDPVQVGADLVYTWIIANHGSVPATGVTFTHAVPAGVSVRAVRPGTKCAAGPPVTCSFSRIEPGVPVTVTEVVRPGMSGNLSITARVTGALPDAVPGNESSVVTVTVNPPPGVPARLLFPGA